MLASLVAALLAVPPAPLTLDDALAEAARANTDLAAARADAQAAGADVTSALGGYLPRLDLAASFGHAFLGPVEARVLLQDPTTGVSYPYSYTSPAQNYESYALQLQLHQPLFDGLRTLRAVEGAQSQARAAGRQVDETTLSVAFSVTQLFYDLVKAQRTLAVLEKTGARSAELVSRADALYAAGRAPKSDTYQARVNLGNDRIAAEGQQARVAQARAALAVALGRSAADPLEVVPPPSVDAPGAPAGEPPPLQELVASARARRPALGASSARLDAARAQVGVASADYWPSVGLAGSYGRQGAVLAGSDGVYGDPSRAYTAVGQVVVSWNLFDGRRTRAAVSRAEASAAHARADAARAGDQVAREVSDARAAVVSLARQIAIAQENLGAATQGLALARERLDAGLATQLELRDASLKLTQAELALVQARIDHSVAVADLSRATGGPLP